LADSPSFGSPVSAFALADLAWYDRGMITASYLRCAFWRLSVFVSACACSGIHAATIFVAQQGDDTYPGTLLFK